jgi:hypothetical protein
VLSVEPPELPPAPEPLEPVPLPVLLPEPWVEPLPEPEPVPLLLPVLLPEPLVEPTVPVLPVPEPDPLGVVGVWWVRFEEWWCLRAMRAERLRTFRSAAASRTRERLTACRSVMQRPAWARRQTLSLPVSYARARRAAVRTAMALCRAVLLIAAVG